MTMKSNPSRRQFLQSSITGLGAFSVGPTLLASSRSRNRTKPNLVFALTDQWRAQATGYAGDPNAVTPNLDALAKESVNFTNAVSGCPVCTPYLQGFTNRIAWTPIWKYFFGQMALTMKHLLQISRENKKCMDFSSQFLPGILLSLLVVMISSSVGALPAFPGAEGFGSETAGGRGGKVIKVTNLNSSGPGSLQSACEMAEPRIVVFEVSGVITSDIVITEPCITIAGQSAPGAGITIRGMLRTAGKKDRVHDVVARFIRVRPDPGRGAQLDAIQF